jgi:hypothetical protein
MRSYQEVRRIPSEVTKTLSILDTLSNELLCHRHIEHNVARLILSPKNYRGPGVLFVRMTYSRNDALASNDGATAPGDNSVVGAPSAPHAKFREAAQVHLLLASEALS